MAVATTSESGVDDTYTGTRLLIFTAVFIPTQIICVALRYLSRWLIKGPWGLDDILVFTSLFLQLCLAAASIGAVSHAGVGYHLRYWEVTDPEKITTWYKYLLAISTTYFAGVNFPKLAILALYDRLFPWHGIRLIIHMLMAVLVMLTVATVVATLLACRPFAANWDLTIKSTCIDKEALFIWGSFPNSVTDIIILALPIRVVWNLHACSRVKVGLTMTFAIGSFGFITSIIRLKTFFEHNSFSDGTWAAVDLILWTQVEAGVYLISACMVTWRPLLELVGYNFFSKLINRKTTTSRKRTGIPGEGSVELQPHSSTKSQRFHRLDDVEQKFDHNILVTKDFEVVEWAPQDSERYYEASRGNNLGW